MILIHVADAQEDSEQAQNVFLAAAVALEQYSAAIPDSGDVPAGESGAAAAAPFVCSFTDSLGRIVCQSQSRLGT